MHRPLLAIPFGDHVQTQVSFLILPLHTKFTQVAAHHDSRFGKAVKRSGSVHIERIGPSCLAIYGTIIERTGMPLTLALSLS